MQHPSFDVMLERYGSFECKLGGSSTTGRGQTSRDRDTPAPTPTPQEMTNAYFANHQQTMETALQEAVNAALAAASPNPVRDIALHLLDNVNPFAAWLLQSGAVEVIADALSPLCDGAAPQQPGGEGVHVVEELESDVAHGVGARGGDGRVHRPRDGRLGGLLVVGEVRHLFGYRRRGGRRGRKAREDSFSCKFALARWWNYLRACIQTTHNS